MAAVFNLQSFLSQPSTEQVENCRKADLVAIANHFDLPLGALLKEELRALIMGKLVELEVLVCPAPGEPVISDGGVLSEVHSDQKFLDVGPDEDERVLDAERGKTPFTFSHYDPLSSASVSSRDGAWLKVHLAHLQMKGQARNPQAQLQYQLEIRKM